MTHKNDDPDRLRAWLVEDTDSKDEADRLLPIVTRLRDLPGPDVDPATQADLTRLLIRELHARKPGRRSQHTVVCIEDDAAMIDLVKLILKTKGFEVLGAMSGPEGLELVSRVKPDLVLLDLMMPGMDGWDVYQRMKADDYMRTVPVIVVTARAQPIDQVLGLNISKVQDYLTKPFSSSDLINRISKVLGELDAGILR
jgi:CheY-like chemotaxis protein